MFLKEKTVKKKKYFYLAKSLRLPDGSVKTIEKIVDKGKPLKELEKKHADFFIEKEKEAFANFAIKTYLQDDIFTKDQLKKIEAMKVEYQYTVKKFNKNQLKDAFDRFTANFTYESNAIEGNSLTLKDVAIVMFEKKVIPGKDLREIYETRNSRRVMDLLLKKKFDVEEKDIKKMHKMLMQDIDERAGYKLVPNFLTGSDVELTPPEKVEKEMKQLLNWYENASQEMHPLQVAALFHGKFEKIHPFEDGNGRVGRFLANIMLINKGYPPLIIRSSQRQSYIKCLEDFHRGYTKNLERLFLEKYKATYRNFFHVYLEYVKKM